MRGLYILRERGGRRVECHLKGSLFSAGDNGPVLCFLSCRAVDTSPSRAVVKALSFLCPFGQAICENSLPTALLPLRLFREMDSDEESATVSVIPLCLSQT